MEPQLEAEKLSILEFWDDVCKLTGCDLRCNLLQGFGCLPDCLQKLVARFKDWLRVRREILVIAQTNTTSGQLGC